MQYFVSLIFVAQARQLRREIRDHDSVFLPHFVSLRRLDWKSGRNFADDASLSSCVFQSSGGVRKLSTPRPQYIYTTEAPKFYCSWSSSIRCSTYLHSRIQIDYDLACLPCLASIQLNLTHPTVLSSPMPTTSTATQDGPELGASGTAEHYHNKHLSRPVNLRVFLITFQFPPRVGGKNTVHVR